MPALLLVLFAAYFGISITLIPYLVKKQFPASFQQNTGLSLDIASARYNPLECSVDIEGIDIHTPAKDGTREDLLSIRKLYADLDLISLLRNTIVSDSMTVSDATFSVFRYQDGTYNISKFFKKGNQGPQEMMDFAEMPFHFSLNNITIRDSRIMFTDTASGEVHNIEDLKVNLPTLSNFAYDVGNYIEPRFSAVVNGSKVELVSDSADAFAAGTKESITRLSLILQDIDLPLYADYIPLPLPVAIDGGRADGKVQISFLAQEEKGRELSLNYQLQITDAHFRSHDKTLDLKTPSMSLQGALNPLKGDMDVTQLLLKDPSLSVAESFSQATVDSLLLADIGRNGKNTIAVDPPAVSVAHLIADNGQVTINTPGGKRVINAVQLSVRNYANALALGRREAPAESSFRLSGEKDSSAFSWQGAFTNGAPVGDVEINNLPFAEVATLLGPRDTTTAAGSVDIKGKLALQRDEKKPVAFSFDQGSLRFSSVKIGEKGGGDWLLASTAKAEPVSLQGDTVALGNLSLENASVTLTRGRMPALLQNFVEHKESYRLQGIDLTGTITLLSTKQEEKALQLKDVHLLAKDLHSPGKNKGNFSFSGNLDKNGSLQAKGEVADGWRGGSLQLSFSDLPATAMLPANASFPYLADAKTTLSGTGTYTIESQTFDGKLEIFNGLFTEDGKGTIAFDKASFGRIAVDSALRNIRVEKVVLQNPALQNAAMAMTSAEMSLASAASKDDDLVVDGLTINNADITVQADMAALTHSYRQKRKGKAILNTVALSGKIGIFTGNGQKAPLIDEFALALSSAGTEEAKRENVAFTARFHDRGEMTAKGTLSLWPLQSKLTLALSEVAAQHLQHFAKGWHARPETLLSASVLYAYPGHLYTGELTAAAGGLLSAKGEGLLNWDKALVQDFTFDGARRHLDIGQLALDAPQLAFTNSGKHPYLMLCDTVAAVIGNDRSKDASAAVKVNIRQIGLQGGTIGYRDDRLTPSWQTEWSAVEGFITNFHLPGSDEPIQYGLKGRKAEAAFTAEGSVISATGTLSEQSTVELQHFPLMTLKEQLAGAFDVDMTDSYMNLHYQKDSTGPSSTAKMNISGLKATDPKSATALTIALLSGGNGAVTETIDIKDPAKTLLAEVTNHFRRLIVKSGVSPSLLLRPPYDSLRDTMIPFAPGQARLSQQGEQALSQYGRMLQDMPRLRLSLQATVDRLSDVPALRQRLEQIEEERVRLENERLLREWQSRRDIPPPTSTTADGIIVEDIPMEDLQEFTPIPVQPVVITDGMLEQLGRDRLEQARRFLLERQNIPPENVGQTGTVQIDENISPHLQVTLGHIDG